MSAMSFGAGWRRSRAASRVVFGAWLVRSLLAAPLALALASALHRLADGVATASGPPPELAFEAVLQLGLGLLDRAGVVAALVLATAAATALWNVLWQGGLAARFRPGRDSSFRAAVADGVALAGPLLRLALLGGLLQALSLGAGVVAALPLRPLSHAGPWWTAPIAVLGRTLVPAATWLISVAVIQRARVLLLAGRSALAAVVEASRESLRSPLLFLLPAAAWCAVVGGAGALWAVARIATPLASASAVVTAFVLLAAVTLAQTWSSAAFVLAWTADDTAAAAGETGA